MGRPSRIKIVRLAAIWKFFRGGHEKLQKTAFFAKIPSPQQFLMGKFFRDRTMRILRSWGFRKCGTFWSCELFNGSYCWSKSDHVGKSRSVPKIRCHHVGPTLIQWRVWKIKIVAVSFFNTTFCCRKNTEKTTEHPNWPLGLPRNDTIIIENPQKRNSKKKP